MAYKCRLRSKMAPWSGRSAPRHAGPFMLEHDSQDRKIIFYDATPSPYIAQQPERAMYNSTPFSVHRTGTHGTTDSHRWLACTRITFTRTRIVLSRVAQSLMAHVRTRASSPHVSGAFTRRLPDHPTPSCQCSKVDGHRRQNLRSCSALRARAVRRRSLRGGDLCRRPGRAVRRAPWIALRHARSAAR